VLTLLRNIASIYSLVQIKMTKMPSINYFNVMEHKELQKEKNIATRTSKENLELRSN
jgi:hypothetical protein